MTLNVECFAFEPLMALIAPFEPIDHVCMWGGVADVINCANFFENPSKGFGAVRPRKIAFPIEIAHRP